MGKVYMLNIISCLIISIIITGCVNSYKDFYQTAQGMNSEEIAKLRASPPSGIPIVERSQPIDGDILLKAYGKRGYTMIGHSLFNSSNDQLEDDAINHALEIKADLVLILNPKYTGSTTTTVPITKPTTTTSYSSGNVTAYGSNGSVTAYGNNVTTTNSQTTDYVPITVHSSDYGALYFIKQKLILGLILRELFDEERQLLQTNKGAVVDTIIDGSPAFDADILIGDIITKVDGINLINPEYLVEYIKTRTGQNISFTIVRRGKTIQKSIQLNS